VKRATLNETPALFPKVPASITVQQQARALDGFARAVDHLNRAANILEKECGFAFWPLPAFQIASPARRLTQAVEDIKRVVGYLSVSADSVLNIEPKL
jgi:hypothetical protein